MYILCHIQLNYKGHDKRPIATNQCRAVGGGVPSYNLIRLLTLGAKVLFGAKIHTKLP